MLPVWTMIGHCLVDERIPGVAFVTHANGHKVDVRPFASVFLYDFLVAVDATIGQTYTSNARSSYPLNSTKLASNHPAMHKLKTTYDGRHGPPQT